ncbi:hypothetical protein HQ496_02050 [bacterium]|nr:hypothetical protein [bacterium]
MAHYNVSLDGDGNPTPERLPKMYAGDTLTFAANGDDAVVCFTDDSVFSASRFEVPDGASVTLTAQTTGPSNAYMFSISVGDLNAPCGGHLAGGGEIGP